MRTLLLTILVVAAYLAGWVSHREWNKRNVEEAIMKGIQRVGGPVDVQFQETGRIMTLRGQNDDEVSEMKEAVRDISSAASK